MSTVVVVKLPVENQGRNPGKEEYNRLLVSGLTLLSGANASADAIKRFVPSGVIGIKTNCLARKFNSTPVTLTEALAALLVEAGFEENDVVIWDRTSAELEKAGYRLNASSFGLKYLGTDTSGIGYSSQFYTSGIVNSLVTRILTEIVTWNINLPILKDHSIAGLSAGLKNMYGAINNPNKCHGNNCDPYAAHVSNLEPIKKKNRLTIIDAIRVQYNAGPGFDSRYLAYYNGLIISDDPVAADSVGLRIVEHFRQINKLPSLESVGRPVRYLKSAENIGLGVADPQKISLNVAIVGSDGNVRKGALL